MNALPREWYLIGYRERNSIHNYSQFALILIYSKGNSFYRSFWEFFSSDRFKINISSKIENWFPLFFSLSPLHFIIFYIGILQSEVGRRVLRFVLLPTLSTVNAFHTWKNVSRCKFNLSTLSSFQSFRL